MAFRFARLLAPFAACAVATLAASCCCQRYAPCGRDASCEKGSEIPSTYSTTFQRLVVTNRHKKPVVVTAEGWDDSGTTPVPVPLKFTPASIPSGGSQAFPVQVYGTNVDRVVVTYLANDDSDQVPAVENLPVGNGVMQITRCIRAYQPDVYTIVEECPPPCEPPCPPACPPACQPACPPACQPACR